MPTKLSKVSKGGEIQTKGIFATCVFYKPNKEWKRTIKNHSTTQCLHVSIARIKSYSTFLREESN